MQHQIHPRLALYQPDIAQNTRSKLRMAACLGVAVDIILPAGFDLSDKALKRAGLDYLDHVDITRHADWTAFYDFTRREQRRIVLATARGHVPHYKFPFERSDIVLMGRESAGVPEGVRSMTGGEVVVPLRPGLRSLNVAVAAGMVLAEALRQTSAFPEAGFTDNGSSG